MNHRWVVLLCSVALLALVGSQASADTARSRVAVVRADSEDRLLRDTNMRLRAELTSAGFSVIEVDRATDDPRAGVESVADSGGSFATVTLYRDSTGAFADVWISDHLTAKTVMRRLEASGPGNVAAVLAIRALELLRASLLELATPVRASEPPRRSAPADVLDWVEPVLPVRPPPPHDFLAGGTTLGVSLFGLQGTRGLGPAVGPSLRLSHGLGKGSFARLSLVGPLFGPEPALAEGRASVRQEFAAADLGFAHQARWFGVFGFLGAGAFHLHTVGAASEPYRATGDRVLSFLVHGGVGAIARLGARVALSAELSLLWLGPRPVVVIADQDVGTAGAPSVGFAIGALVGL